MQAENVYNNKEMNFCLGQSSFIDSVNFEPVLPTLDEIEDYSNMPKIYTCDDKEKEKERK